MKRIHMKTEARQEQIAAAALEVIFEDGVHAMTIERVARSVGLAPSALYRHFDGKNGLLLAVIEQLKQRLKDELVEAGSELDNPLEAIHAKLMYIASRISELVAIPRIIFSDDVFKGDSVVRKSILNIVDILGVALVPCFEDAQRRGLVRKDIPVRQLIIGFMGMYVPSAVFYHASDGEFDIMEQVSANWKIYAKGIQPDENGL